jgi:hypothetical protein
VQGARTMSWLANFGRRRGRTAFWLLAPRRLVAAVLEPTTDEPLLISCATLALDEAPSGSDFAPGLLETATAASALGLPQVAALDREWCRIRARGGATRATETSEDAAADVVTIDVHGADGLRAFAAQAAIANADARFRGAGLRLVALDCADCAFLTLAMYLGRGADADVAATIEDAHTIDPLTAVSVAPECERAAAHAADVLAVPVGLALARFGLVDHA